MNFFRKRRQHYFTLEKNTMARKDFQSPVVSHHPNSNNHGNSDAAEMVKNEALDKGTGDKQTSSRKEESNKTNKMVSFHHVPVSETITIESLARISRKEKEKRWVSSHDFVQFKQDCMNILKEISRSNDIFAYRGLEMVDPASTAKRQRHNTDSVAAVLLEQRSQRQKGKKPKPKDIKKAYKSTVVDSMKEAIENAYIDHKAVQDYLQNTMADVEFEHRHLKQQRIKIDFWDRSDRSKGSGTGTSTSNSGGGEESDPNRRPSLFRIHRRRNERTDSHASDISSLTGSYRTSASYK